MHEYVHTSVRVYVLMSYTTIFLVVVVHYKRLKVKTIEWYLDETNIAQSNIIYFCNN